MPLVTNSLGADTQTHTHTDVCTETILRNQVRPGHRLVCVWFKKYLDIISEIQILS